MISIWGWGVWGRLKSSGRTSCRNISSTDPPEISNSAVVGITQHLIFLFAKSKSSPIIRSYSSSSLAPCWIQLTGDGTMSRNLKKKKKWGLSLILFLIFWLSSPSSPLALIYTERLLAWEGAWPRHPSRCVRLLCQSDSPELLLGKKRGKCRRANGEVRDSPSPSHHKSCLAAQNKLLLETSLLALYLLPFITSEELKNQKRGWKKKSITSRPTTPAFLSSRQGNTGHQWNPSCCRLENAMIILWKFFFYLHGLSCAFYT